MRFQLEQRFRHQPGAVARAFADPRLYPTLDGLTKLPPPVVLDHRVDGDQVTLHIAYRFAGDLPSAARAVIDPDRLTWVEVSVHDLGTRQTRFELVADHYADRFQCAGWYRFDDDDGAGTVRRTEADLRVRAPLVSGAVERAIVSGLREHQSEETPRVEAFLDARATAAG